MTPEEEQILFCKKCLHRKLDFKQGLVCRHTGSKPEFDPSCPEFSLDKSVKIRLNDKIPLTSYQIRKKFSAKAYERLKRQQNMPFAILEGIAVGICCVILWCFAAAMMEDWMNYLAIVIGTGIGFVVRFAGNGVERAFGICGAVITLLSCFTGKIFFVIAFSMSEYNISFDEFVSRFRITHVWNFIDETFVPIDLLFYAIAVCTAYRMSFRFITEKTAHELNKKYSTIN